MNVPKSLFYTKSHEWVEPMAGGRARIGITEHAQEAMGDLVYVELPPEGDEYAKGESIATVESVKATSEVFSPVAGTVSAVNDAVTDNPALVNEACYDAWFVELSGADCTGLLTPEEYEAVLARED